MVLVIVTVVVATGLLLKLKTKCEWPRYALIVSLNEVSYSSIAQHGIENFSGQTV